MKEIILKSAVVLGLSLLLVLCVDMIYRRQFGLPYHAPRNLLAHPPIVQKYQLVTLGNSHTESAITFQRYDIPAINLSAVAQRFETDLALLRQYQHQIDDQAVILINVSPISFSHTNFNSKHGFQAGYYGRVSPFFIPNLDWGDYIESQFFPFVRSGYFWRQNYDKQIEDQLSDLARIEFDKNTSKATASPTVTMTDQAKVELEVDQELLDRKFRVELIQQGLSNPTKIDKKFEQSINFIFNKWYYTDEFDVEYFATNRRDLEKLINFCLRNNWRPVLMTVPITYELEEALLDDYKQKYLYENLAKSNLRGAEYFDFSSDTRFSQNNLWFSNADHLSPEGAAAFSYLLLRQLIDMEYLNRHVDRYDYRPLEENLLEKFSVAP